MRSTVLIVTIAALSATCRADVWDFESISSQVWAFGPNAGGQRAFSLRGSGANHEVAAFVNTYLLAGGVPLLGATYSWRFQPCEGGCWWPIYTQVGIGGTTAGPLGELTWGTHLLWLLRIDFTTHFIVTGERVIVWPMPLWFGLSVPVAF